QFECRNGQKIDADLVCNIRKECDDGSDETNCSFDWIGQYFLQKNSLTDTKWKHFERFEVGQHLSNRPTRDSSSEELWGHYLLLKQQEGHFVREQAVIEGSIYNMHLINQGDCEMRFFYMHNGNGVNLSVQWLPMHSDQRSQEQ